MSTTISHVSHTTYNVHTHGDCEAVQIGKSKLVHEQCNHPEDSDVSDLRSEFEDFRFEMNKMRENNDEKMERKDKEIAELKDRVADLEAFKRKVEVMTNTNTGNNRRCNRNTSDSIALKLVDGYSCEGVGSVTVSKKDSFNDLKKLIEEEKNVTISDIAIWGCRDGSKTRIYDSRYNNKNDYSLDELGFEDQDDAWYCNYV